MGVQSSAALATPVAALVRPGPRWVSSTDALAGHPRIAVGGVRGDLLVPDVDEVDLAVGHRREHGDVGVPAQAEDMRDAAALEVADQLMGNEIAHFIALAVSGS